MNLCHIALLAVTFALWFLHCESARRVATDRKMKVEQSNGMFIVRHRSIDEPKTQGLDLSPAENVNLEDFGQWSPWSRCRKQCKQVRRRTCQAPSCVSTILMEERDCTGHRCLAPIDRARRHRTRHQKQQQLFHRPAPERSRKIRVLYHLQRYLYSPWSEWQACKTKTCHTSRFRVCLNSVICQNSIIKEDALCYTPGSECEKQFNKPQTGTAEIERSEEIVHHENQVTSGQRPPIDDKECGYASQHAYEIPRSMLRIIGGKRARHGRWPWMVAILNGHKQHFCGGTLITPQFVVTAAHCVKKFLFVRVGEHNFAKDEGTEQEVAVSEIFVHPQYDNYTVDNDIALLKLESPLEMDEYVSPICLPSPEDQMAVKKTGTILGWGKKRNTETFGTPVLQQARVPIVDPEECKTAYSNYQITENMICAGHQEGKVDSCAGDSGGPLMLSKKDATKRKRWYLYGITSFGEGCGKKGKVGIYAKVPRMVDWIQRTIRNQ